MHELSGVDEACSACGMENEIDNPALVEVTYFLQAAWLQLAHVAMEWELDADLDRE